MTRALTQDEKKTLVFILLGSLRNASADPSRSLVSEVNNKDIAKRHGVLKIGDEALSLAKTPIFRTCEMVLLTLCNVFMAEMFFFLFLTS